MVPLRIVVRRAKLGVMVEVPARELARRDAARHGVQPAERPLEIWTPSLEHRVMHDLVQQDREVEDREALHEGERNPDERVGEGDQAPRGKPQDGELPRCDQEMTDAALAVERFELVTRNGRGQLCPQSRRMGAVEMAFHGADDILASR